MFHFFQNGLMTAEAQLSRVQAALQQLKLEALSVARFSSLAPGSVAAAFRPAEPL